MPTFKSLVPGQAVALALPGASSSLSVIRADDLTNAAGVVFGGVLGAIAIEPKPIMPDTSPPETPSAAGRIAA